VKKQRQKKTVTSCRTVTKQSKGNLLFDSCVPTTFFSLRCRSIMSVVRCVEKYFGQSLSDCFEIINVAPDGNCGFHAAQIFLEFSSRIKTASTINDFRRSISDYIDQNIDELATCTAAGDWRIGTNFRDKVSILRQYQTTIYNPEKNYIDGCSRPDWFIDQWFSLVGKQFNFATLLFSEDFRDTDGRMVSHPPCHTTLDGLFHIQYDNTHSQSLHPSQANNRDNIFYCLHVTGPHFMWLRPK
jgi:hypothetical protein